MHSILLSNARTITYLLVFACLPIPVLGFTGRIHSSVGKNADVTGPGVSTLRSGSILFVINNGTVTAKILVYTTFGIYS